MAPTPRRKKWTEEEERTLIEKYGEMVCNGVLSKMKTREKKFRPIAAQVNSLHHSVDPVAFPWQWSWKDASTKVQNMRHQYLLVKQKIKKPGVLVGAGGEEDVNENGVESDEQFDWVEDNVENGHNGNNGHVRVQDDGDDGIEYEDVFASSGSQLRKRRKKLKGLEKRAWAFFGNQFAEMRERERLYEDREVEREQKRLRREQAWGKIEQEWKRKMDDREKEREEKERAREKVRRDRVREWEVMEKESVERERRRREEELSREMEWENRREQRRLEWTNRIGSMLSQHRAAMDEIQSRILHDQQNLTNQLLGMLSQWTGHPSSIPDHTGAGNPYLSQMLQNLHHMSGIVHSEENRVEGDNHEDQFIVDDG